jgi:hypothetical protein
MILAPFESVVITPQGADVEAVFAALRQKKTAATVLSHCLSPSLHTGALVPIQVGRSPLLEDSSPSDRMLALLTRTLFPLLSKMLAAPSPQKALILVTLPAKSSVRYAYCSKAIDALQNLVDQGESSAPHCTIAFLHEDEELVQAFLTAQQQLQEGVFDRLFFGGFDSFFSIKAIRAFEATQSIRKEGNPEAPLLGEGAAFIALSSQAPIVARTLAITAAGVTPHALQWISNRKASPRAEFDWYEWMRPYPQLKTIKEVHLQKWMGHLGAAQFPVQLALGYHWATRENAATAVYNADYETHLVLQPYRRLTNKAANSAHTAPAA